MQHTGRPFSLGEKIPNDAWQTISKPMTKRAAEKRLNKIDKENREAWGPIAWGDHYRMVPTEDIELRRLHTCLGHFDERGTRQFCPETAETVSTWAAFQSKPPAPTPAGWHSLGQCQKCRAAELAARAKMDEREEVNW